MLKILVIRPEPKCSALAALLNASGFLAYALPSLEIVNHFSEASRRQTLAIEAEAVLIFVSENAVHGLVKGLTTDQIAPLLQRPVYAIGESTARLLKEKGFQQVRYPQDQQNSEGLLTLFKEVKAAKVFIFRGSAGRELIYQNLKKQGFTVQYISTYSTRLPMVAAELKALWQQHHFDAVVATSLQGLKNFQALLGADQDLTKTAFTAMRGNMLNWVQSLGAPAIVLERADNITICQHLKEWADARKRQ